MSLENDVFAALRSLASDRVYPNVFPQQTLPVWPAIRFVIVSSVPVIDICGDDDDSTPDTRLQIDVVAVDYDVARALRLQVMGVMQSFVRPALLQLSFDAYDEPTRTHRCVLDYSIEPSTRSGNSPP